MRTARTIADLDGAVKIGVPHISEAICFRSADKSIWRICRMAMEIFTVGRGQEGYPERLMPFADMPSRLFVRGALPADEQKTAAIVGARICT
ncbi:DNA-processing protein DprA, partial [Bifidobacterium breve]|nr:DNA-processing protein DprA [Bifidobacterium breve]